MSSCRPILAGIVASLMLAGCAAKQTEVAIAPPPPAPSPQPMPQPPHGAVAGMTVPARLPDGGYATPNAGLAPAAALWHVRTGLNVAALSCRGANEATIVAQYNALLHDRKAALAEAHAALLSDQGQAGYDEAMTRLYNYWARPAVQDDFCAAAAHVLAETAGIAPTTIDSFATGAIARLDAPFVAFFRAYDTYRIEFAQWQANRMALALQPVEPRTRAVVATSAALAPSGAAAPRIAYDPSLFTAP